MQITKPTYLIAELGGDVVSLVLEMRKRFNPDNQYWPADITIAGSSGVGTLKIGQNLDTVVDQFSSIIQKNYFRELSFIKVERFPGTGIYYLEPERQLFDQLHKNIIQSEVEFDASPWPYNPHCTLCWHEEDRQEYKDTFQNISPPENSTIDCFSLYQPEKKGGCRIHKFE